MMGRRTKLTPERQQKIISSIRLGMRYEDAAIAAGIHVATFYAWKVRGEAAKSGIYYEFLESIKKAEAEGEQTLLDRIHKAGQNEGQWQANAWILERRHRNKWGRNVDVTSGGEVIKISITRKDAEDAEDD